MTSPELNRQVCQKRKTNPLQLTENIRLISAQTSSTQLGFGFFSTLASQYPQQVQRTGYILSLLTVSRKCCH